MGRTRNVWKKLFAIFMAAAFIFGGAVAAFADENSENTNVILEQSTNKETGTKESSGTALNYSELEHNITVAVGLNEHEYTKDSWKAMRDALNSGIKLLDKAKSQQEIDDAAGKLGTCIESLVRMDYSQLEKALGIIYGKIEDRGEIHSVFAKIDLAVSNAKSLLASGDQQAVDAAVAELNLLIEELDGISTGEPETIIKEVEVQVPPSDDYCNIAGHKIWPVLFFISFALNIALVAVMGYVFSKLRNSEDNIPLVSYDIDDDIDEIDDYEDYGEDDFADEDDISFDIDEDDDITDIE